MSNPTVRAGDIKDDFGSGFSHIFPGGSGGTPSLRDVLRALLAGSAAPFATTAAMQAGHAKDRFDGQLAVRTSDYSLWIWEAASAATADATHIQPTDVTGNGRWVQASAGAGSVGGIGFQSGTGVLVAGESVAIAATITASSRIVALRKDFGASTAIGSLEAKAANRVVGAPGSFKITSIKSDTTQEVADISTFDWIVFG